MSKINILFHSAYGHARMGGQKSLLTLIDNLDREKFNPFLIVQEDGELRELAEERGIEVLVRPLIGFKPTNYFKLMKIRNEILDFVKKNKIHIIHSDNDKFAYFSTLVAKKTNVKTIYHARVAMRKKYDKKLESRVDKIIGISEAPRYRFPIIGKSDKYKIIYNGTDCDKYSPNSKENNLKEKLNIHSEKKILLFVGKLRESKGLDDSIKALHLIDNCSDFEYFVIGSEENPGDKERYIQMSKDVNCKVSFLGQKDNVYEWMQVADIVLFPSHNEGMGRVPFEAMATGTPVIACNIPGVNEAVNDEVGILVQVKEPKQIADAIIKIASDKELYNKLATNGRKRALELFDIKVHAKNMMDLFEEMVNKNEN